MAAFKESLSKIKAFVFDVDGVFTDGGLYLFPDGEMVRKVNIKDGFAVKFAIEMGFKVAIISGGDSLAVKNRFLKLGVSDVYLPSENKWRDFQKFSSANQLKTDEILYMGDDIPDFEIMKSLPVTACPSDASIDIKRISAYISTFRGGEGCVRDIIEQVLRTHEKWLI